MSLKKQEGYDGTNAGTHTANWNIIEYMLRYIWDDSSHKLPNIKGKAVLVITFTAKNKLQESNY